MPSQSDTNWINGILSNAKIAETYSQLYFSNCSNQYKTNLAYTSSNKCPNIRLQIGGIIVIVISTTTKPYTLKEKLTSLIDYQEANKLFNM